MDYLDFELEIRAGKGKNYPVAVLDSPAGEARGTLRFPFDDLALDYRLLALKNALLLSGGEARRKIVSEEEKAVQEFGADLFNALVSDDVRSSYDLSRREAARLGKGLRVKLRIQAPELAALPWEFLFDPRKGGYLGLSKGTPLVRYLELTDPIATLAVAPPLRILGLVASPANLDPLDIPREKERVERALEGLHAKQRVELEWLPGQSWRDVQRAMRRGPWHVLHFIGHGGFDTLREEGTIALVNEVDQQADLLSATLLGQLLADHPSLRLVLLNACDGARASKRDIFSSTAATLVRNGIPAVLAMQYEISDKAAVEFARTFYEALADGLPVDTAVAEARNGVSFAIRGTLEWGTPVLHMRAPDGQIFDIVPGAAPPPTPVATVVSTVVSAPPRPDAQARLDRLWVDAIEQFYTEQWSPAATALRAIVDAQPNYKDAAAKLQEAERQEQLLVEQARRKQELLDLYAEARQLVGAHAWQAVVNLFARNASMDDPERLLGTAQAALASERAAAELQALFRRGLAHMDATEWPQAVEAFEALLQREPGGYRQTQALLKRAQQELDEIDRQQPRPERALVPIAPATGLTHAEPGAARGLAVPLAKKTPSLKLAEQYGPAPGVAAQDVTFLAHAGALAVGFADKKIRVWDVSEGKRPVQTLDALSGPVRRIVYQAPTGRLACGHAETVRIWAVHSLNDIEQLYDLKGDKAIAHLAFAGDSELLVSGSDDMNDKWLRLWRTSDGELTGHLDPEFGPTDQVRGVAFSPDARLIVAASDRHLRIWEFVTGGSGFKLRRAVKAPMGWGEFQRCIAFAPDGDSLAVGSDDKKVRLWSVSDGTVLHSLEGHTSNIWAVAFSPAGDLLASASGDGTIRLWRVTDGEQVETIEGQRGVRSIAFAPDGSRLAAGADNGTVRVWDIL